MSKRTQLQHLLEESETSSFRLLAAAGGDLRQRDDLVAVVVVGGRDVDHRPRPRGLPAPDRIGEVAAPGAEGLDHRRMVADRGAEFTEGGGVAGVGDAEVDLLAGRFEQPRGRGGRGRLRRIDADGTVDDVRADLLRRLGRTTEAATAAMTFMPFSAQTRMSGVDFDNTSIRKGAAESVKQFVGGTFPNFDFSAFSCELTETVGEQFTRKPIPIKYRMDPWQLDMTRRLSSETKKRRRNCRRKTRREAPFARTIAAADIP